MKGRKKSRELSKKKEDIPLPAKQKMIKFNFSEDNLKCFMTDRHPKTDRKRAPSKYNPNMTDEKKYKQTSPQHSITQQPRRRQQSPDPSIQASNEIIEQIQKKGLKCQWNQIEESKTEISETKELEELQLLNQTFSERSSSYKSKNTSYASSVDRFEMYFTDHLRHFGQQQVLVTTCGDYINQAILSTSQYIMNEKIKYYDPNVFDIDPMNIGNDPRTTLMVRNIPNKYTIQDLSTEIDHNFENTYDFLYLPCDIKNNCNVGYGFINFLNTEILLEFYQRFHNKKWIKFRSDKICVLTYARLQGLDSLIDHFQNSKVLNHKDKRYQPIIKDGRQCSRRIDSLIKQQKSQQSSVNA